MQTVLAALLIGVLATGAFAQTNVSRVGGAEFSEFRTFWVQKREGCQPSIAFKIKNVASAAIGPINVRMEVVDKDNGSVFAKSVVSVPSDELPSGKAKEIAMGGDREIAPHDCLGDMHEAAFSTIHFIIRLIAADSQDSATVEILTGQPASDEVVPAQD